MSKKKVRAKASPTEAPLGARAVYASDLTFRALVDTWVSGRRCPLVLVDRCLELNLPDQADCARWAATEPERWCGTYRRKEIRCGPYPAKHRRDFYFCTDDVNATSAYTIPRARIGRQVNYTTERFNSALNALLWLLDSWRIEPPKNRTRKKRDQSNKPE